MKKLIMVVAAVLGFIYLFVVLFFYFKQESFLFYSSKTAQDFDYPFSTHFEEQFYETPNNGKIHSLRFKVNNPKGIILYFHGNAGNLEDWGWVYQNFQDFDYDLEIVDYRNFGKSTGKFTEENLHSDAQFIYDEIKQHYQEEKIVIYGRSIGTGMATKLASENNPKMLILETPFYNIVDLVTKYVPFLPTKLVLKYRFENNKHITNVKAPIYILHGTSDEVVPYQSAEKLFDLVKDKAEFITFENGTHGNLSTFEKYYSFLEKVLN